MLPETFLFKTQDAQVSIVSHFLQGLGDSKSIDKFLLTSDHLEEMDRLPEQRVRAFGKYEMLIKQSRQSWSLIMMG